MNGYERWLTVSKNRDAEETILQIKKLLGKVDWLVIDSYALDIAWEQKLCPWVDKIFVIDDLANRHHDCDVLLDQNFYLDMGHRYDGLVPENCRLLLGPRYALLREEFYKVKKHLRERTGEIHRILVFYGGSDATNETMKALYALDAMNLRDVEVDVVVGGSNPHNGEVEAYCKTRPQFHYHCQVNNMAEMMNSADLALGAGGSTTWERCFLELPAIVTAVAENQVKICEDCARSGLITYIGTAQESTELKICRAIQNLTPAKISMQRAAMHEMFKDKRSDYGIFFT